MWGPQPGHEYTKQNVKFLVTVLQNDAVRNLQKFAENNEQTQGKFTIGDEKVRKEPAIAIPWAMGIGTDVFLQQYNAFMRVDVRSDLSCKMELTVYRIR